MARLFGTEWLPIDTIIVSSKDCHTFGIYWWYLLEKNCFCHYLFVQSFHFQRTKYVYSLLKMNSSYHHCISGDLGVHSLPEETRDSVENRSMV